MTKKLTAKSSLIRLYVGNMPRGNLISLCTCSTPPPEHRCHEFSNELQDPPVAGERGQVGFTTRKYDS